MTKFSGTWNGRTAGVDLGDKASQVCVLDEEGKVLEESRIATTRKALTGRFQGLERMRIVIETGTHTNWVAEVLTTCGHEVVVSNARKVRAISTNDRKDDRADAQLLARLGRVDARLLAPIKVRDEKTRLDLAVLRSRSALVEARTQLINHARGTVKAAGHRLPKGSPESFHKREIPKDLEGALGPVLSVIAELNTQIASMDKRVEALCELEYPQTKLLRQVCGIGPITALCFVLTVGDVKNFKSNRQIGPYLGMTPRRQASGQADPELRITKAGDQMLRRLLVQGAHYNLGPFGKDSDLRRFGLRIAARGGKVVKRKAVIATARKLAVLLLALLRTAEVYEPLRNTKMSSAVMTE
jgi:transposase